jgi:hypothetical protein
VEQEEAPRGKHPPDLREHGQRLVEDVQHRRHAHQIHGAGGVGQRGGGHVVEHQRGRDAGPPQALAIRDHRRRDVVAVETRRRVAPDEIAQEEARTAAEVDHDGTRGQVGRHAGVEGGPVVLA